MAIFSVILVVAVIFGICYLVDKGFTKLFRSKVQHQSGRSVRLSKRYGSIGLIMFAFGTAAVFMGINNAEWVLVGGAALLVLGGIALVTYYMSFGIYYDEEGFVLSSFGKRSVSHTYGQIKAQQLYISQGKTVIELHFQNGQTITLQHGMKGVDKFMDQAFAGWLKATGKSKDDCDFHDPDNSCWFPPVEE